ncbi:MAG: exo-alpha-sialidase [Paludisphaera borealis]|uniref:GDSL-type esterase/lipase family protein n=1 Tax=Paludisphaera borealis TaxID=1387353 RepID=UPI002845B94A|nr:GDSL-type esterase/lipase family protein [Paludisphaera borealis]MDR3619053.1 exo-alpha-sialidase [Paludisphaera borealis]
MRSLALSLSILLLGSVLVRAEDRPPLAGVRRVVFLGDSITYAGQYVEYVEAYLRAGDPALRCEFLGLGLPSETLSGLTEPGHAGGAFPRPDVHERLDRVLATLKPDLVVVCYGMNDGIYHPFSEERFQKFRDGMHSLRAKAKAAGAKVLHVTPPVFDPAPIKANTLPAGRDEYRQPYEGYDEVLNLYSAWLLAHRGVGWDVVDAHGPMERYLARERRRDPHFRLADDGVHINAAGHWLIARAILLHWGIPARELDDQSAEQALGKLPRGLDVLKLVERRQQLLKDAWLTAVGHKRPGMAKGLPLEEAEKQAGELDAAIRKLSEKPADPQAVRRGYTIPLVDLAHQEHRQVVVDREKGQYLGHPTTVLLEDGKTILAVYPKGHGRGAVILKRSTDGGRTWSDRLPTPENWATSKETPTIHRVVDRAGVKRLILFSGLFPIRMSVSEDDGTHWTPLAPIGDFGGIVAMGSVERLKNGDYMALFHDDGRYFHGEGKATKFRVYKTVSNDGGLTWGRPEVVAEHPTAQLCEPGLIRSPDGDQLAVLLRENSRKLNAFVIFSNDEGKTWTEPRELPGALTGDRHVGKYAPDGRLFISFRDMTPESPTKGDWVGWVGTYDDIVQGREGQYRVRLMDNTQAVDCAYPGVEVLPDGTFVATTYGHWTGGEPPYIVSVRFKLSELDALAKPRPKVDAKRGTE